MRLAGRVALITGASSGIGRGIALRFAQEGAKVVVNYLGGNDDRANARRAQAEEVVAVSGSDDVVAIPADVSKRDEVDAMIETTVHRFGRLDIVVNNAGIEIKRPFIDVPEKEWDLVIAVNLKGPFNVTQAAVRQILKQENLPNTESRGKIINISSTHEDIPFPGHTSYCVSKGGIRMFCRDLSVELSQYKININNIAPGAVATPINQTVLDDPQAVKNALSEIPWGRFGTPEEIAGLATWLASEEANYVTGSTYYMDGALSGQVTLY